MRDCVFPMGKPQREVHAASFSPALSTRPFLWFNPGMSIHILNCLSMSPPWRPRWQLGGVSLLVETDEGPVLVDTGLGLHDYRDPSPRVRFFIKSTGIHMDPDAAVVNQVPRLGWPVEKVRHIVLTHLHFDHAGGLPDFPQAWVHVYQSEYAALRKPRTLVEWMGYNQRDFTHGPKWVFHDELNAKWFDFAAIRLDFKPEMYLIPLPGHTRGHCGVAVRIPGGWLLDAGDALPPSVKFGRMLDWLYRRVIGRHLPHLKEISQGHPEVQLVAGHMRLDWFSENKGIKN